MIQAPQRALEFLLALTLAFLLQFTPIAAEIQVDAEVSAPDEHWNLRIDEGGFEALATDASAFRVRFELQSIARGASTVSPNYGDVSHGSKAVERSINLGIQEWWRVTDTGIEHGFTFESPIDGTGDQTELIFALTGNLHARPIGDRGLQFFTAHGLSQFRYDGLKVFDAHGTELPASMHWIPGGFSILFNDRGATYPITVDPIMSTAAWTEVGEAGDEFGDAVSTAGDVNGDGYSDVLVGEPLYDGGQTDEGRVRLFLGSASGLSTTASWSFESNSTGAHLGRAVSTIGDVNNDGYDDIVVGAPNYTDTLTEQGAVFVFYGSASGPPPIPNRSYYGKQKLDHLGTSVSFAGDVNNDGFHDLVVGVPGSDSAATDGGEIYLYYGGASGLSSVANWAQTSAHAGAAFGTSVSAAGDVNGDGYGDIIVGAPTYDFPEIDEGRFFVYHGSSTTPSFDIGIDSDGQNRRLGTSVAGIGDVNGDGYADVAAGAPGTMATSTGRANVYYGSSAGITESGKVTLGDICCDAERMGEALSTAGDVNGDGYGDLLVGSPAAYSIGIASEGLARVYVGSADGIDPNAYWIYRSGIYDGRFGAAAGPAGDVDGDGYSDIIVGAPGQNGAKGRAFVFLGSGDVPRPEPVEFTISGDSDESGTSAAFAGDINADGFTDVAIGDPGFSGGESGEGRVVVYHGAAGGLDPGPFNFLESNNAGAEFGRSVESAGDVDGDGYEDLIVGAPGWTTSGGQQLGRALLYRGSESGLFEIASWQTESDQDGSRYGDAVAGIGDVNADGFTDVAVGAPEYSGSATNSGRVYVFLGSASGLSSTPFATLESDVADADFGTALGSADFNGDGFDDLLVGAPTETATGRVTLYRGTSTGIETTPFGTLEGLHNNEKFGHSVSGAGDYNGDGIEDIVVGAPQVEIPGQLGYGRIHLFRGQTVGLPIADGTREIGAHRTGHRVGSAGDVNGDGYGDVVATANADNLFPDGRIGLWLGGPSGVDPELSWWEGGTASDRELGAGLASGGDIDGDGFDDLISSRTSVFGGSFHRPDVKIWYGGWGPGVDRVPRLQEPYGVSDPPIATRGKSPDNDSIRLRSRARTAAGRDRVQVEYEVKPLDESFTGSGTAFSSELKSSSPGSDGSRTNYSTRILNLNSGPQYRFRLRHLSPNPWFPRTPWMVAAGCDENVRTFLTDCVASVWYRDQDGDGFGDAGQSLSRCVAPVGYVSDASDCDDNDGAVWSIPGEATFDPVTHTGGPTGTTTFSWSFGDTGGTTNDPAGDLIRSDSANGFDQDGVCFQVGSSTFNDSTDPGTGVTNYYLVRGRNGCGSGTWGVDSDGLERTWQTCP